MSTYYFLSLFLFFASCLACASLFLPIDAVYSRANDRDLSWMNTNEETLPVNDESFRRYQRSSLYYPRASRNTWFRVATYQHFKPTVSEEIPSGDNPLRWG